MAQRKFLFHTLLVAILLAALHLTATFLYLYWTYPWLDLLSHFLGGILLTFIAAGTLSQIKDPVLARGRFFATTLLLVFAGALLWEAFEYLAGVPMEANFRFDTSLDVLFDFLGAASAYAYAVSHLNLFSHER